MPRQPASARSQSLAVFLMKPGLGGYRDALKEPSKLTEFRFASAVPFTGRLFLAPQRQALPGWLQFLQGGVHEELGRLLNTSTSAVVVVEAAQRMFALTFGYGRAHLRQDAIERAFGLRIVLNSVDSKDGLRSLDTSTIQELTVHTRRQASRGSGLEVFGLDAQQDLLSAVTGTPLDQTLGRTITGSDAVQFSPKIQFIDIGATCADLLKAYRRQDYKTRGFAFVDHMRTVADPAIIDGLDARLIAALVERDLSSIHMAPPEIVDWRDIEGFSYSPKADPARDMDVAEFLAAIRKPDELTVERLRRQPVYVHELKSQTAHDEWSVYNTLVAEFDLRGRHYVLTAGDWYEIETDFVQRILGRIQRIPAGRLGLCTAARGEREGDYNARAARKRGVYLTDRKLIREGGSPIELCDLYTSNKQFVHVKRWSASSTLSHLFAQGITSAESFLWDAGFRDRAREMLREQASALAAHVPQQRPQASSYQLVYAIITTKQRDWRRALPFFTQLHMARAAEHLSRLGFQVAVERIGVEA